MPGKETSDALAKLGTTSAGDQNNSITLPKHDCIHDLRPDAKRGTVVATRLFKRLTNHQQRPATSVLATSVASFMIRGCGRCPRLALGNDSLSPSFIHMYICGTVAPGAVP
jgi:hypothetical protein